MNTLIFNSKNFRDNAVIQKLYAFSKIHDVELYLVGGSVRDMLLNRSTADFDFTLKSETIQFAKSFAESMSSPFVPLEEQPPTARVIVKTQQPNNGELCIDFTQFRAKTLIEDLCLRDLTINAMAIPLVSVMETDHPEIIDPCNGINNLEERQLLFPSEQVILDDPLRLMRIFRFSAQLDFHIPQKSFRLVQKHSNLLPNVSPERVRDELFKLLKNKKSNYYLQRMSEADLLPKVIPSLEKSLDSWSSLERFEKIPIPESLSVYRAEIETYLNEELGLFTNRCSLIKFCLLNTDYSVESGKHLRLSRKAVKFLKCISTEYPQLSDKVMTKKQIIAFLRDTTSEWWGVLLFSAVILPIPVGILKQIAETYYQHLLPILKRGRLISGEDLIRKFQLKEGREIGVLLKQIEEMQHHGEIQTRTEAFTAVEKLIQKKNKSI
ncbi:CCA tRNA nucleotidyltransferase [Candidatus Poribacteria bacterium]|nr:CCA tRNA nucleotidyltransferase [Candidatus Poribacteria bacterium]